MGARDLEGRLAGLYHNDLIVQTKCLLAPPPLPSPGSEEVRLLGEVELLPCWHPGLILVQPVSGFQIGSVHSMAELALMAMLKVPALAYVMPKVPLHPLSRCLQ